MQLASGGAGTQRHISTPQSCLGWQSSMPFTLVHGSGNRGPEGGTDLPKMSQWANEGPEIRTLSSQILATILDNMENVGVYKSS